MRLVKDPALKSEANKQGLDKTKIVFNLHIHIEGIPRTRIAALQTILTSSPAAGR